MEVLKPKVKKVKERSNKKTKYLVKINTNLRLQSNSTNSKASDEQKKTTSSMSDTQMQSDEQNSSISYYDEAGFRVTKFVDRSSQ